ncbi:probable chalcone--flavonone isomerase 3 [Papaver somniferum]|uniref:probable chalcone--flavonone isomerase 3 n=1 Tax=Papaver somniferum TaxID=3469 RepID=UPI000E6FEBDC|nr:probable chalcone--flavonone isomerase 3 [Papaver somniferum]
MKYASFELCLNTIAILILDRDVVNQETMKVIEQNDDSWDPKSKTGAELSQDDEFLAVVVSAPVEKYVRIVVIKEIKGSQYMLQLERWMRDDLAAADKYKDEESLEKVIELLRSRFLVRYL